MWLYYTQLHIILNIYCNLFALHRPQQNENTPASLVKTERSQLNLTQLEFAERTWKQ